MCCFSEDIFTTCILRKDYRINEMPKNAVSRSAYVALSSARWRPHTTCLIWSLHRLAGLSLDPFRFVSFHDTQCPSHILLTCPAQVHFRLLTHLIMSDLCRLSYPDAGIEEGHRFVGISTEENYSKTDRCYI